jgi:hypothetical protein
MRYDADETMFTKEYRFRATLPALIVGFIVAVLVCHYMIDPIVFGAPRSDTDRLRRHAEAFESLDMDALKANLADCDRLHVSQQKLLSHLQKYEAMLDQYEKTCPALKKPGSVHT